MDTLCVSYFLKAFFFSFHSWNHFRIYFQRSANSASEFLFSILGIRKHLMKTIFKIKAHLRVLAANSEPLLVNKNKTS